MKLLLERNELLQDGTRGNFYIDNVFFCFSMEDVDGHLESGGVKVPGETAIPRGTYRVIIDYSNRFNREMPHVLDVPGFSGVRIHNGNTQDDTEGCVLLGSAKGLVKTKSGVMKDGVLNSRATFETFFNRLDAALQLGEEVTLEVR